MQSRPSATADATPPFLWAADRVGRLSIERLTPRAKKQQLQTRGASTRVPLSSGAETRSRSWPHERRAFDRPHDEREKPA